MVYLLSFPLEVLHGLLEPGTKNAPTYKNGGMEEERVDILEAMQKR